MSANDSSGGMPPRAPRTPPPPPPPRFRDATGTALPAASAARTRGAEHFVVAARGATMFRRDVA